MYTFELTRSRLKLLQMFLNGHGVSSDSSLFKLPKDDHLADKLKIIANYLLIEGIQRTGGMKIEVGSSFICNEYLFVNNDWFADRFNPLTPPCSITTLRRTHTQMTWNEFLDLPIQFIFDEIRVSDTLYFCHQVGIKHLPEYAGVFVDFKKHLTSQATYTHTPIATLAKEHGYTACPPFPVFRIYKKEDL